MQYTICGYQQAEVLKLVDTVPTGKGDAVKTIRIDATDLVILRWFAEFYAETKKAIIDGREYGWVRHGYILEQLPIIDISVKAVNARMKKLVHFKLLEHRNVKVGGNWSYYRLGERYANLVTSDSQLTDLGRSTDPGSPRQTTHGWVCQPTHKDSSTSNPSTRNEGRVVRFAPPTRDEVEAYASEKGWHGFPTDRFIAYYESNGWKVGRNPMKSWRAAMSNWWHRDHSQADPGQFNPLGQSAIDAARIINERMRDGSQG